MEAKMKKLNELYYLVEKTDLDLRGLKEKIEKVKSELRKKSDELAEKMVSESYNVFKRTKLTEKSKLSAKIKKFRAEANTSLKKDVDDIRRSLEDKGEEAVQKVIEILTGLK